MQWGRGHARAPGRVRGRASLQYLAAASHPPPSLPPPPHTYMRARMRRTSQAVTLRPSRSQALFPGLLNTPDQYRLRSTSRSSGSTIVALRTLMRGSRLRAPGPGCVAWRACGQRVLA